MQSNNNEAAILPIDSFLEKSFPFTDITLHLSADAITFLMGTTKGHLNLMYYLYILHTMTIGDKSQMVRGIRVDTGTCQCSLSVSSLEEVWGIKRKQGRNLLDKMEQLGLISRSSDFVTSIVDVVSVQDGHAMGQVFTNPNRLLLAERNQTSPVLSPPTQSTIDMGIVSPMYICFRVRKGVVSEYLEHFFSTSYFFYEMQKRLEGSVRQCLSFEGICNIPIYIPNSEEQHTIGKKISVLLDKIDVETLYHCKLVEQKHYLLRQMFI